MVFLSERSRLSIDMFLADVASGKVIRQLTKTAADPHFDSLEFLASAGDWAPDNKRFVFSALSKGQPVLTIIDVDTISVCSSTSSRTSAKSSTRPGRRADSRSRSRLEGRRPRSVPVRRQHARDPIDQRPVRGQRSGMVS